MVDNMDNKKLKQLRKEMKCSMAELAEVLGIPKSTFQRYEDGSAKIPVVLQENIIHIHKKDREFMRTLPRRLEADLKRKFPHGIISAVCNG